MNDKKVTSSTDAVRRPLPMPTYEYQVPRNDAFVTRYDEQRQRQEKAAQEKTPELQNLKIG